MTIWIMLDRTPNAIFGKPRVLERAYGAIRNGMIGTFDDDESDGLPATAYILPLMTKHHAHDFLRDLHYHMGLELPRNSSHLHKLIPDSNEHLLSIITVSASQTSCTSSPQLENIVTSAVPKFRNP